MTPFFAYAFVADDGSINGVQTSNAMLDPVPSGLRSVPVGTSDITHFFDGKALRVYSNEEVARRQARPSLHHVWSVPARDWVDARSVEQLRADTWEMVKRARADAINGHLVFEGMLFQTDAVSRAAISDAADVALHNPLYSDEWTTADNEIVDLTADQLIALQAAVVRHVSDQHATARGLRELIEAPDVTREQLLAVAWP